MARSLWKGKIFIKEFIAPAYQISRAENFKTLKFNNQDKSFDDLKIYRRNHLLLDSQIAIIKKFSFYQLYNGYDFIKKIITINSTLSDENQISFNLATTVSTREMNVTHKVKLSKAARKNNAKLKKRASVLSKSAIKTSILKKKTSLSKKIK